MENEKSVDKALVIHVSITSLTLLSETLEEVLRSSGDPADQKYVELKARAEKALDDVKKRVTSWDQLFSGRRQLIVLMTGAANSARNWCGRGR